MNLAHGQSVQGAAASLKEALLVDIVVVYDGSSICPLGRVALKLGVGSAAITA